MPDENAVANLAETQPQAVHRVLLVEDSEFDAELIRRSLGTEFKVTQSASATEVEALLGEGVWELVLFDWNVPGVDVLGLLSLVGERLPGTPCMLLSGSLPMAELVSAMQLGARDSFDKNELSGLRAAAHREIGAAAAAAAARRREQELLQTNSVLYADALEQAQLVEALYQIALTASGELNLDRLVHLTVESGQALLGEVRPTLTLLDESGLRLLVAYNPDQLPLEMNRASSEGLAGRVVRGLQPVIVNDYASWPDAVGGLVAMGVRSVLAAPLVVNGRAIGSLAFHSTRERDFSARDAEVVMMLAAQLAPAIAAARTHEEMTRRAAKQALVADLGRAAVQDLGDDQLVPMALAGLVELLQAESAAVMIAAGSGLRVAVGCGWLEDFEGVVGSSQDLGGGDLSGLVQNLTRLPGWPDGALCTTMNLEYGGEPATIVVCRSGGVEYSASEQHFLAAIASILTEASRAAAAERAVRDSEERYQLLFESALEGVWHIDREGRTLYANRRMAEILRCDLPTLQKATMWEFTDKSDLRTTRRRFEGQLRGAFGRFERRYLAADGTIIATSVAASPIRDKKGEITGTFALVTDLTDRRAAEQAMKESEEKSRFLAGMSHELRTPMNSILGFAQLLEDPSFGPLTERQQRYVGHVRSQGQHLLELINDVLDLSKVAAGQMDMVRETVDLSALTSEVAARMRPLAEAKGQELKVVIGSAAVALADRLRVAQSLLNLVSNAVKFAPQGGHIIITVASQNGDCSISVTDDGPGIAPEDQVIVFDEFSKLSSGRRGQGTGLGLSLTRRLVQAMGGRVTLESVVGRGSDFRIELPAA